MTDIVERLRLYGSTDRPEAPGTDTYSLLYDAADEIARLRAALEELAGPTWIGCGRGEAEIREWVRDIARSALNQEAEHE